MKDIEITIKLRNNRLKERRLALGMKPRELAEAAGMHYARYLEYESMKRSPLSKKDGLWTLSALALARFHGCGPEELFPTALLAIVQPEVVGKIEAADMAAIATLSVQVNAPMLPDAFRDDEDRAAAIADVLAELTPREREVIECRFGFDGKDEQTLDKIGQRMRRRDGSGRLGIKRECVRMIEGVALRKMRHPSTAKRLREFL